MGLWCLNNHRQPLMSYAIGQVWREVVGCRNLPVMWVPQFIGLRRNYMARCPQRMVENAKWFCKKHTQYQTVNLLGRLHPKQQQLGWLPSQSVPLLYCIVAISAEQYNYKSKMVSHGLHIVPTEVSNRPKYMYIAYLISNITDLTYICGKSGLAADC